jgi:hypothetical protein
VRTTTILLLALMVTLLGGCGGESAHPSAETGAGATSTTASSTEEASDTAQTTTTVLGAPCGPGDSLPVLQKAFNGTAPKLRVVRADVERCRNGYAQVFAVPDTSVCEPGVAYCYETEQVFLHWRDGSWRILTSGTGIVCGAGTETLPLIIRICRALGYPDLAGPAFRMPSGNIGCRLAAGILRCDILSGLNPEPGESCELDWVGVALSRHAGAEPLCAGDTVYDQAAPTLAYGGRWRSAGFTCDSTQTGLSCTNRAGRRFSLARGGWTVS